VNQNKGKMLYTSHERYNIDNVCVISFSYDMSDFTTALRHFYSIKKRIRQVNVAYKREFATVRFSIGEGEVIIYSEWG